MVEFSLLLPLLVLLLAVAFDGFVLVYSHMRGSFATTQVTRELATGLATQFNQNVPCVDLDACSLIDSMNLFAYAAAGMEYEIEIIGIGSIGYPVLQVTATRQISCLTCWAGFPWQEMSFTHLASLELPPGRCVEVSFEC